ncbi:hypothetical protein IFM89_006302 [Coptis chinensis]|uniref:Uncharacterized protein n=1 Tax=Coptis chinensis TaxID=261450 RepID=A0A835I8H1_9MAGN|nr:hypothetical protein IFM89_006302 [Coptis chinensis]
MAGTNQEHSDSDDYLATTIDDMIQNPPPFQSNCCIYKVPQRLRSVNEEAYTPEVVSIGPLHYGKAKLQPMEAQKQRYLKSFLSRNRNIKLKDCVKHLRTLETEARTYYNELQFSRNFESDEFVQMMLLDGCFIFEVFLINTEEKTKSDPIFMSKSLFGSVYHDLLLLENQLPYFVLEHLFNLINGPNKKCTQSSLLDLTVHNFSLVWKMAQIDSRSSRHQIKHFLDLLLSCYTPPESKKSAANTEKLIFLPSATELRASGVKFKKRQSKRFLDIVFTNGVLKIPTLHVYESTEYRWRNLVAMEQGNGGNTSYVTDYVILMDFLINTPEDVTLLQSSGIIVNWLGSKEDVCQMFNRLGKGVITDSEPSHYYSLVQDVNLYCRKQWHVWNRILKTDYLDNPWTIISLAAAVLLLICTSIQAVCSIISVLPKNRNK